MKLNLLRNSNNVLNGYTNIDPYAKPDSGKVMGDVMNLDEFADDGEVEEVLAEDVIDFVDATILPAVLDNWVKKLAHGGRLIVGGVDLNSVCRAVIDYNMKLDQANALLHGNAQYNWDTKKMNLNLDLLKELLSQRGLKILSARTSSHRMMVVAQRP